MMGAYYNEIDPFAAGWLRELIKAGHIAAGEVDERSIEDVTPEDIKGFTQCHFFAGIGVWSHALRQAGWPDDEPLWTGSCPCQPFSCAGSRCGVNDERHLWPTWFRLVKECRPVVIFGEQVDAAVKHGWLDLVQDDLEGEDYAVGALSFPACSVGAPHARQRLYWVADSASHRRTGEGARRAIEEGLPARPDKSRKLPNGLEGHRVIRELADPDGSRLRPNATNGFWRNADWLFCRDGKWRSIEPGAFALDYGSPARVGRLRGYGNAIVAPQAKAFIRAFMDVSD